MTKYRDLSGALKWAIIGGWISLVVYGFSFLVGFMEAL